MKKHKKAYTLAEILLITILAAFLVVYGTQTLLYTQHNYRHLYYSAFSNLKHAVGEMIAKSPDGKLSAATLCTGLLDSFNVMNGATTCTYTYAFSPSRTFSATSPNLNNPPFTLMNGQRLYVGNTFYPVGPENYFDVPATMVAVDLNGTAKPNILDSKSYTSKETPDVVAFAVLENGIVLPMSPMADRQDYISADVQQCSSETGCDPDTTKNIIAKRVSVREALSISNSFPPKGAASTLGVQYNTDNLYSFQKTYAVNSICAPTNTTSYCKIIVPNMLLDGVGSML